MDYFSDLVVAFLAQQRIKTVAFNPGASFRGIHDSLVHPANAAFAPEILMCCHEEIAVALAHGHFKASGRHMAVLLHSNVGLLHASMALFNAWCDRVPLFVLGGNGPIDAGLRRPWIDWIHTSQGIGSAVGDFVKWWDQPIGQRSTLESLYRAYRLMATEVQAPVYVAIDFATQEEPLQPGLDLWPDRTAVPGRLAGPHRDAVADVAERLARASMPVIVVDFGGRDPASVAPLCRLAEMAGAAVLDRGNRYNFPNIHPLNVSGVDFSALCRADLVIAVDVQDLRGALDALFKGDAAAERTAAIVVVGTSELAISKWAADYQALVSVDATLLCDGTAFLSALAEVLPSRLERGTAAEAERSAARSEAIGTAHRAARDRFRSEAAEQARSETVTVPAAVAAIAAALADEEVMLANTGSLNIDGWVKRLWVLDRPGCYLGLNGGAGLGYGIGASIGAAVAAKDDGRLIVDLQSDGDLLYAVSALWTASAYDVALLVIVMNNRLYLNSTQHAERIATARGRDAGQAHLATSFHGNPVDFVGLARSFNVLTMPRVERPDAVEPAIRRAARLVRLERKPVLVEIVTE